MSRPVQTDAASPRPPVRRRDRLLQVVRRTLARAGAWPWPGGTLLVGVSGGVDSVVLLHVLHRLRVAAGWKLVVVHVHHGLRGRAADADERLVAALAHRLRLPAVVVRRDVAALARAAKQSLEMAARAARFDGFRQTARARGACGVMLGHTADDQAETLVLRIARGTSPRGLAGMSCRTDLGDLTVWRPLLEVPRETVRSYAVEHAIPWREDRSNEDRRFLRNRVRHEIMPLLAARLNPKVREALTRLACQASDEARERDLETRRLLHDRGGHVAGAALGAPGLQALPPAMARRLLQAWLLAQGASPESLHHALLTRLEALVASIHGTRTVSLPGGARVVRRYGRLRYEPATAGSPERRAFRLLRPGWNRIPELGLRVKISRHRSATVRAVPLGFLPAETLLDPERVGRAALTIRTRRPGDRFRPSGMQGSVKLQDLFVNARIPADRRDRVPLIVCRKEIVWIPGRPPARGWSAGSPDLSGWHVRVEPDLSAGAEPNGMVALTPDRC